MFTLICLFFIICLLVNIDLYEFFIVYKRFYFYNKKMQKWLERIDDRAWWKENKPKYIQHKKDVKDLKKELRDFVDKDFGPWCNCTLEFLKIQCKYWIKYYGLGFNVHAMEIKDWVEGEENHHTRLEIAKHLQLLIYRYEHFHLGLTDEELIEYEADLIPSPAGFIKNKIDNFFSKYRYINDKGELVLDTDAINRDYLKCKQELFDYYFKYADEMGD